MMSHTLTIRILETLARMLFGTLGAVFSPGWWLCRQTLGAYLNLPALLSDGVGLSAYYQLCYQLKTLGRDTLLFEVMPLILLILAVSVASLVVWSKAGQLAVRALLKRYRTGSLAG